MSEAKTYKFKSAGIVPADEDHDIVVANEEISIPPIGIKTPIQFSLKSSDTFIMNSDLETQTADNLRNLCVTNFGERLGNVNFGANLRELAFELGTDTGLAEAQARLERAVSTYMPFVSLSAISPMSEMQGDVVTESGFILHYGIPSLGVANKALSVILYSVV